MFVVAAFCVMSLVLVGVIVVVPVVAFIVVIIVVCVCWYLLVLFLFDVLYIFVACGLIHSEVSLFAVLMFCIAAPLWPNNGVQRHTLRQTLSLNDQ